MKTKIKKFVSLALAFIIVLGLSFIMVGCSNETTGETQNNMQSPAINIEHDLIGRWVSSLDERWGYVFNSDGTTIYTTSHVGIAGVVSTTLDWSADGNQLIIGSQAYEFDISEDVLTLRQPSILMTFHRAY